MAVLERSRATRSILLIALVASVCACAEKDLSEMGNERVILNVHTTSQDEMPINVVDSAGESLGELHFDASGVGTSSLMFRRPRGAEVEIAKREESPRTKTIVRYRIRWQSSSDRLIDNHRPLCRPC